MIIRVLTASGHPIETHGIGLEAVFFSSQNLGGRRNEDVEQLNWQEPK